MQYWVGKSRHNVTILERAYDTLEEAQADPWISKNSKYSNGWVIVETDDPDQWELENNKKA